MKKAEKMTKKEISCLPWGSVVWIESHCMMDCGTYGIIDGYRVFPALIGIPGEKGYIISGDRDSIAEIEISEIGLNNDNHVFWNKQPEPEQIEQGMPIDEACEILNKYEIEQLHLKDVS